MTIGLRFDDARTWVLAACVLFLASKALGQENALSEVQQLRAAIREQRETIEKLLKRVDAQQALLDALESRAEHPIPGRVSAQTVLPSTIRAETPPPVPPSRNWYERINLRGYVQMRYNGIAETNPELSCEQCDKSLGSRNGMSIRRARMVFSGDLSDRVYFYLQPDFASSSSGLHFGQLRDLYFDLALDKKKEFRIRAGQSKVPFGFENLQSSQNRLAMDRADAVNSAVANERDVGLYLMWAPAHIRQRFKYLVDSGLKGSGDYGVVAVGVFNGQNANRPDVNSNLHRLARVSYPWQLPGGQIVETGVQAYSGQYTVGDRAPTTLGPSTLPDRRVGLSVTAYPQPFGLQAEYNWGSGPTFVPSSGSIEAGGLQGGYLQLMHRWKMAGQAFASFAKAQYFSGGKKFEFDARRYLIRQNELGLEWQLNPLVELTTIYTRMDRTYEDSRALNNRQMGRLVRVQLQFNY